MKRKSEYIGIILFSLVFIAAGVGISIYGWHVLQDARVSQRWPTVEGQIIRSKIQESTDEDGTSYFADVRYKYVVDDHRYTADMVNFGQYGGSRPHAQSIVRKYEYGGMVSVYYDPTQPQTAVLEPGVTWSSFVFLGVGAIFVMVGIIVGWFFLLRSGAGSGD